MSAKIPVDPNISSLESVEELRHALASDPVRRENLVELVNLGSLLQGTAVDQRYSVPDTLSQGIALTPLGKTVFSAVLHDGSKLKPNDIKLALFLEIGCPAGLFIEMTTSVDALRKGFSIELKNRRVLLPYIFGRDLHDLAVQEFPRKHELSQTETVRLLKMLPVGVFQEGLTTTGPFGALRGGSPRQLISRLAAPGYLCSDATCTDLHNLILNTANRTPQRAPINRAIQYVSDYVKRHYGSTEDRHIRLIHEATSKEMGGYSYRAPEAMIETIADSLNSAELASVVSNLLKGGLKKEGSAVWSTRLSSVITNPDQFVANLDVAQRLQITLLFSDEEIASAVDQAVLSNDIALKSFEIRERKVGRFGHHGVRVQIGSRGIRATGEGSYTAERLQDLLHHLYFNSTENSPEDLSYALEVPEADTLESTKLLDAAVQQFDPDDILRRLVLNNRKTSARASAYLGVPSDFSGGRDELLKTLLWKLGAPSRFEFTDLDKMQQYTVELTQALSHSTSQDEIRGIISNLFAAVEGALRLSLEFSVWVLTHDHFLAEHSFVFDPGSNPHRLQFIEDNAPVDHPRLALNVSSGANTLVPLGAGFTRLAKALEALDRDKYLRTNDQVPLVCRQSPRPFAFHHVLPFLDLSVRSRSEVVAVLREVSRLVQDDTVLKVRNAPLHGVSDFPTKEQMLRAISNLDAMRNAFLQSGLYPIVFELTSRSEDLLGREKYLYLASDRSATLLGPSWAVAPNLPLGTRQLLIVEVCKLSSLGPLRFRIKRRSEKDKYWDGWPKRWEVTTSYSRSETVGAEPAVEDEQAG